MGLTVLLGAPAIYNYEAPEGGGGGACLGASGAPGRGLQRPPGGLQLSSAGTGQMHCAKYWLGHGGWAHAAALPPCSPYLLFVGALGELTALSSW